jgi:hypothetical protein
MPLVISHHLLNVFVQLANKRRLKKTKQKQIKKHFRNAEVILESLPVLTEHININLMKGYDYNF